MKYEIDANDAVSILIEMTAESIATTRLLIDAVCELSFPEDKAAQLAAKLKYLQQTEEARKAILDRIYEARGKVDLNDIGLGNDSDPKQE